MLEKYGMAVRSNVSYRYLRLNFVLIKLILISYWVVVPTSKKNFYYFLQINYMTQIK